MKPFTGSLEDIKGAPLGGVTVTVYDSGTQNLATIYSDNGITAKSNPFTNDANGMFTFFSTGRLRVQFAKTGHPSIPSIEIVLEGAKCFLLLASDMGGVAAASTVYLLPGYESTVGEVTWSMPFPCKVRNLYGRNSVPPGGAQTFVYTLRKNGVDTALTVTVTGAAAVGSDLTNVVTFATGDQMSFKLVTSATAGVAVHTVTLEVVETP